MPLVFKINKHLPGLGIEEISNNSTCINKAVFSTTRIEIFKYHSLKFYAGTKCGTKGVTTCKK